MSASQRFFHMRREVGWVFCCSTQKETLSDVLSPVTYRDESSLSLWNLFVFITSRPPPRPPPSRLSAPFSSLPLSWPLLLTCRSLMFWVNSLYHTNFPLFLFYLALTHMCTLPLSTPSLPAQPPYRGSIHPPQSPPSPPLTSLASLFEVIRALVGAHATPVGFYPRGERRERRERRGEKCI